LVGKTETTKKVLSYLANVAPAIKSTSNEKEPGIEDKILQSNPLLEALGNAKTLRNNNSSRFGKWMKVDFEHSFRIQGCEVVNYLLEKSRVVTQSSGERNYHIFYQLLSGADDSFTRRCGLASPDQYAYLNQCGCYTIEEVDDAKDFCEVQEAMQTLQFSDDLQTQMLQIIAAILHMGNITFIQGHTEGSSQVDSNSSASVELVSQLLGLKVESFTFSLTEKRLQMGSRGSVVSVKLNPMQAVDSKDTLSKALYSNMFDWVIRKINETLKTKESPFSIGILDIFGFEVFEVNSFEQLCINYANEKLQFHFNEVIFNEEMKMYSDEGVPSEAITFVDNGLCVDLIEGKPIGLLSLLDEECSLGQKATDLTYASKISQSFGPNRPNENSFFAKHKTRPEAFTVHHFAGPVEYVVTNFLDKNKDSLSATLHEVAAMSEIPLVADLFAGEPDDASRRASMNKRQSKVQAKSTLGGQFRNQLIGLVTNLRVTEPHFVRCVKPNHQKKPAIFDGQLALRQLRYAGLFEAIRIRQSGFAYRVGHSVFAHQYSTLVDGLSLQLRAKEITDAQASVLILEDATHHGILLRAMWYVGKSKVFIKTNQDRIQLERQRIKRVEVFAVRLQAFARSVIARLKINEKKYEKIREEQKLLNQYKLHSAAVQSIQRVARGFIVRKAMAFMSELVNLRRELSRRNVDNIEVCSCSLLQLTICAAAKAISLPSHFSIHIYLSDNIYSDNITQDSKAR
jgi:myosin heavy subunit